MKTFFAGLFRKNLQNFFIWASFILIVWMLFFDSNDLINQFQLHRTYLQLQQEKQFYEQGIKEILEEKGALRQNPYLLEKLAREKYKMSSPEEDVYVTE